MLLPDPVLTVLQNGTASLALSPIGNMTGTVIVRLKVTDNGRTLLGGKDETVLSFLLTINAVVQPIFLPTLFSPNGNGVNDALRVRVQAWSRYNSGSIIQMDRNYLAQLTSQRPPILAGMEPIKAKISPPEFIHGHCKADIWMVNL
jgi:hypothetical protein